MTRTVSATVLLTALLIACSAPPPPQPAPAIAPATAEPTADTDTVSSDTTDDCPAFDVHEGSFPNVDESLLTAAAWESIWSQAGSLDEPVLSEADIATHNRAVGKRGEGIFSQNDLLTPVSSDIPSLVRERLTAFTDRARDGEYVSAGGHKLGEAIIQKFVQSPELARPVRDRIHVALETLQLRCAPFKEPVFAREGDQTYDRNACSAIAPQEPIDILGIWPDGMLLVRTRFTFGWITADSPLSPEIPDNLKRRIINGPRLLATADTNLSTSDGAVAALARFTSVPQDQTPGRVIVATRDGFHSAEISPELIPTTRPLTRRTLLKTAFSFLDTPYGYGGMNGGRDCSAFLAELFASFDLALPRTSEWQSKAGSFQIDLSQATDENEKLQWIDQAHESGIALLYFPGHIMLYLGRTNSGVPLVMHALGEYVTPCEGGGETIRRVQRVVVSDLNLGRSTSRRSLLERTTAVIVLGRSPSDPVFSAATLRPSAPASDFPSDCKDSAGLRIFVSPRRPVVGERVRIIAIGDNNRAPSDIALWDANTVLRPIATRRHPGTPAAWIAEFVPDQRRRWTAALTDGDRVLACHRFSVGHKPTRPPRMQPEAPYWKNRWNWEKDTENLFSVFVSKLFDFPLNEDRTWNNLQALLADPKQNILYNHLGQNEDNELSLSPDCADLPFVLRAYFAWKISAPFGVRSCSRGKADRPPSCGEIIRSNEQPYTPKDNKKNLPADAFQKFASVEVSWSVHSAAARTPPYQSDTDLYPVSLSKTAIVPGTVFADPYGHVMLVTGWIPQKPGVSGVLMAVDGQPDNTIGRRRFWPGTFLFDPDTTSFGAGFKRFRPLVKKRSLNPETGIREMALVSLENRHLDDERHFAPYSTAQYSMTSEAFYESMDALINPFPRPAAAVITERADALEEAVKRRVIAVELGREHAVQTNHRKIEMPAGYEIFETTGPWEDYASPSRDMRLLIAIDDVLSLIDRMQQSPARFGIDPADASQIIPSLASHLSQALSERIFSYPGSDGRPVSLSLAQLIDRQAALETGYNPNDCPEIRWGAPDGSAERGRCAFRAPEDQQQKMREYRPWFHSRQRPRREN